MAAQWEDFVWYVPRNHFYYVPTGMRWVKTGVVAAVGPAIELIIKKRAIIDKKELDRILGRLGKA